MRGCTTKIYKYLQITEKPVLLGSLHHHTNFFHINEAFKTSSFTCLNIQIKDHVEQNQQQPNERKKNLIPIKIKYSVCLSHVSTFTAIFLLNRL